MTWKVKEEEEEGVQLFFRILRKIINSVKIGDRLSILWNVCIIELKRMEEKHSLAASAWGVERGNKLYIRI